MESADQDASSTSLLPGTVVGGRFRIESQLGSGAMADVFRVHELQSGTPMALKLLRREVAGDREAMRRLEREGEVLARLHHPAIVASESFGTSDDGRIFLAMELLEGETLGRRMGRGPMTAEELAPIVAATAGGLSAAHQHGVVHRDLKPDNIFLAHDPENVTPRIKILDFGISKVYGSEKLTQTGQVLGTPRYMAPEQLSAEPDLDARVDIYAMGVILYEALSGQPPFSATTPSDLIVAIINGRAVPLRSVRPDVPPYIESIVMRAMAHAKEARYESSLELGKAWLEATADAPAARQPSRSSTGGSVARTDVMGSMAPADGPGERGGEEALAPATFRAFMAPQDEVSEPSGHDAASDAQAPGSAAGGWEGAAGTSGRSGGDSKSVRLPTARGVWGGWALFGAVVAGIVAAGLAIAALQGDSGPADRGSAPGGTSPARAAPRAPGPDDAGSAQQPSTDAPSSGSGGDGGADARAASPAGPGEDRAASDGPGRLSETGGSRSHAPRRRNAARGSERSRSPAAEPPGSGARSSNTSGSAGASADGSDPAESAVAETSDAGGSGVAPSGGSPSRGDSTVELLTRARSARRAGDPQRCVELIDRAMAQGAPASILHLRGDCLREAGRDAEALRAYERFCRLVPDHPAIPFVRERVQSLGGRCR